jgi:hypothetical protein
LRCVNPAEFRLCAQQVEVFRAGNEAFCANRTIAAGEGRITRNHRRDLLKHSRAVLQVPQLGRRHPNVFFVRTTQIVENAHELLGMGKGQGPKQDAIHHTENGDIRANSQRQRQHGDDREASALKKGSNPVAQVLTK